MARPDQLCEWAGVELILGGPAEATKLLDPKRVGLAWQVFKTKAIQMGTTQVLEAYGVQNQIAALRPPYDPSLVQRTEIAAAIWAWNLGTGNQALPSGLERLSTQLDTILEMWATRRRNPAQDPEAPNQHLISDIDPDPENLGWTRRSLGAAGYG